jgi:bifunctional UDP-N-acetylglucosamine pyrophosphorylase/glucosamine-1-phosphate N-acetyltransferase
MEKIAVVILAAGLGKRLGGELPKVLHETSERPLLAHVVDSILPLNPDRIAVVTGYRRELVEDALAKRYPHAPIKFAYQAEQRGTGHAVKMAAPLFSDFVGTIVILYGDAPLLRTESIQHLLRLHQESKATASLVTALLPDPASYGRILRDPKTNQVTSIREAKDCSAEELLIKEICQGSYAVDSAFLWPAVEGLKDNNAQKEFYLTDVVTKAASEGQRVASYPVPQIAEALGVNDRYDMQLVNQELNARRVRALMRAGVVVQDPLSTFIDASVSIAPGVILGPNVQIRGACTLEAGVVIDGTATITNCKIHDGAHVKLGVVAEDATLGAGSSVGPFAHIRPGSDLGPEVKIGNFVETKKAVLKKGVKASHLTYLGDCVIDEETNIGAGTITCNYDGYQKYQTTIGKGVFIGSNSSLVAPVTIEDGATVGAGSVITERVEKDALAVTRAPQLSKAGWSQRKREIMTKKKSRP